jgi:hypothetical protein
MDFDFSNNMDVKKAETYMVKLIASKSKASLTKHIQKRTIPLNSYLHVCITLYAIHFGYTLYEAKIFLKRECGFMVYENKGLKYLKETSKLNNEDCSKFVEFIRNYSSMNGCYIPDADEYKTNKFNIDKEINNYKQYL